MLHVSIPDEDDFNRFVSYQTVSVKILLGRMERDDYHRGDLVEVWFKAKEAKNPSFIGKIVEDIGAVELGVDDYNYHSYRVLRQD